MASRIGWILVTLLGLAALALAGIYMLSGGRMVREYEIEVDPIRVPNSEEAVERGRYLVDAVTKCADCHGEDLGGEVFIDDPAMGHLSAANLTSGEGGIARRYTRDDWVRAIRHGVGPDRQPLLFMPAQEYNNLSDEDLGAILGYLQTLEPVDRELDDNRVGPLARTLFLAGKFPLLPAELIDHDARPAKAPPRAVSAEYGEYLTKTGGCVGCHGESLSGGPIPGAPPDAPPAGNITPHRIQGIGRWNKRDFFIAMRTGKRPNGTTLDPFMPWAANGRMTDDDLSALWLYLSELEPKETGES